MKERVHRYTVDIPEARFEEMKFLSLVSKKTIRGVMIEATDMYCDIKKIEDNPWPRREEDNRVEDIEPIIPPPMHPLMIQRWKTIHRELKKLSGVNEELLGPANDREEDNV